VIDSDEYYIPVPENEVPSQGTPNGGDISTIYEVNWDLWQQWMNSITKHVPYMVSPGNHEAACAEFDGPNGEVTAILQNNEAPGSTANKSELNYYSCPPTQRNFTAYQHRFHMPGDVSGGKGNFWYSFDYGLAHFISFDGETDYYQSPSWPFIAELKGNETHPAKNRTFLTDAGPFGRIDGDKFKDNKAYEQYKWLVNDLKSIDRKKTPWVFATSHRPMYSSETAPYQTKLRNAYEDLFLEYNVDAYFSGHIHWYERMFPLGKNGTIDHSAIVNNNTYIAKHGSITHLVNGAAGNMESHSTLRSGETQLPITAVLDQQHYGLFKLTVINATATLWEFIHGKDGTIGDYVYILKE
jgi:acid phosphatase